MVFSFFPPPNCVTSNPLHNSCHALASLQTVPSPFCLDFNILYSCFLSYFSRVHCTLNKSVWIMRPKQSGTTCSAGSFVWKVDKTAAVASKLKFFFFLNVAQLRWTPNSALLPPIDQKNIWIASQLFSVGQSQKGHRGVNLHICFHSKAYNIVSS